MACKCCGSKTIEHVLCMEVVSMTAESAMEFAGSDVVPVDLRAADPDRYKDGARVWGFPSRKETATERAERTWATTPTKDHR